MIKKILFGLVAGLSLASCTEDYTNWASPQSNDAKVVGDIQIAAQPVQSINLADVTTETVQVCSYQVTATEEYKVDSVKMMLINPEDIGTTYYPVQEEGYIKTATLAEIVSNAYGIKAVERTMKGYVQAYATTTNGVHVCSEPATFELKVTPEPVTEYYLVGTPNSWKLAYGSIGALIPTSKTTVEYTSYFTSNWDCRIATPDQVASSNWSNIGSATDNCKDATGTLLENTSNCITSPEAGYYTLKADMENMTYSWEKCEDQNPTTYSQIGLVGMNDDWDNDVVLTQLYTSDGNPSHMWFAQNVAINTCSWGVKFRVDAAWDTSFGSGDNGFPYGIANGGDNITVKTGTYDIYFNDITKRYYFLKK